MVTSSAADEKLQIWDSAHGLPILELGNERAKPLVLSPDLLMFSTMRNTASLGFIMFNENLVT
jgi:hypothetical protein